MQENRRIKAPGRGAAVLLESFGTGGRTKVVLKIAEMLNRRGIAPEVYTIFHDVPAEQTSRLFGMSPDYSVRKFALPTRLLGGLIPAYLNFAGTRFAPRGCRFIIYTNSAMYLPKRPPCLVYVNYPCEGAAFSDRSIPFPEIDQSPSNLPVFQRFRRNLHRAAVRMAGNPPRTHIFAALTKFSRSAMTKCYGLSDGDMAVVYPPSVKWPLPRGSVARRSGVISIGRISPEKRQLEQVDLAARFPRVPFCIAGTVDDHAYLNACRRAARGLSNVRILVDLDKRSLDRLMQSSAVYLHSFRNEPFGMTIVEAIAAGCLPVVHDSGGPCEIVPDAGLRFSDARSAADILRRVLPRPPAEKIANLQKRIAMFSDDAFERSFGPLLDRLLAG